MSLATSTASAPKPSLMPSSPASVMRRNSPPCATSAVAAVPRTSSRLCAGTTAKNTFSCSGKADEPIASCARPSPRAMKNSANPNISPKPTFPLLNRRRQAKTRKVQSRLAGAFRLGVFGLQKSQSQMGGYLRRMKGKLGKAEGTTAAAHKLARIVHGMIKSQKQVQLQKNFYTPTNSGHCCETTFSHFAFHRVTS